ncbi:NAD(P)H-dependent oxidoreductase [Methanolobus chelungpuianus]|uniref:Quinone oxidoreductase n=1 Tax=Methanolobus chelungpuianus TaxID=502115 RepID=A0AAE3HBI9_9EURY|nr:NAD(P)H-dependent oxidoreductase [Methanolobus chelungpuianus]MCQ6963089.1 quinone oxidoreductase [Methanolobus chelungpuianus]
MKILYIFAHPEPRSFNSAMKEAALRTLDEQGHEVKLSDLFAMDFKPVLDRRDFLQPKRTDVFNPFMEQMHASKKGTFSKDIMDEMEKVTWVDILIFQFPIYFTGFPAMIKGWIDRVFAAGFAFNPATGSMYEAGLLRGKKAMLVMTAGADEALYSKGGAHGDINELLRYITHCTLGYTGLEVLPSYIVFGAGKMSEERVRSEISSYIERLRSLAQYAQKN